MKVIKKIIPVFLFSLFIINNIFAQTLNVDKKTYTSEQLVKEVLITGSVVITNIKFTGSPDGIGYFSGGDTTVCFETGIVLATGDVKNAIGPNKSTSTKSQFSTAGDTDLNKLVAGNFTTDAAVLEFDFKPSSDTVRFVYIFASEEYPEYVKQGFNDVFAFFLSGKNPAGGEYENLNIALIEGTTTPVSIDNINHYTNKDFYTDNATGKNIEYDGLTKPLIAQAIVVPGETYHIKIAICDVGDADYDSGVFLKATSFYGGSSLTCEEKCYGSETKFILSNEEIVESCSWNFGDPDSKDKNISTEISPTHKFTKGGDFEITVITNINGISDTLIETITISGNKVNLGEDFTIKTGESITLDAGEGGISYLWSTGSTDQKITVNQAGEYSVEVTFEEGCVVKDSVVVTVKDGCICCLLALIFGIVMAITSLVLFLICRKRMKNM